MDRYEYDLSVNMSWIMCILGIVIIICITVLGIAKMYAP